MKIDDRSRLHPPPEATAKRREIEAFDAGLPHPAVYARKAKRPGIDSGPFCLFGLVRLLNPDHHRCQDRVRRLGHRDDGGDGGIYCLRHRDVLPLRSP